MRQPVNACAPVPTRGMMKFVAFSMLNRGNVNGRKHAAPNLAVCSQSLMIAGIIVMGVADYLRCGDGLKAIYRLGGP